MQKMGRTKTFQTALEQLSKHQNDIATFCSTPPSVSSTSSTTVTSKRQTSIPEDLDLENVYNPKYTVVELISTRRKPRKQAIPPRPPNSFFLFKNCYMLELRKLNYRYCMPDVCRQSKLLWSGLSPEVKERYAVLALQAVILHQEMYPEYKFQPKKRQIFRQHVFPDNVEVDSSMLNTFTITNFLGDTKESVEVSTNINNTETSPFPPSSLSSPTPSSSSSSSFSASSTSSSPTTDELEFSQISSQYVSEPIGEISPNFEFPLDIFYLNNLNNLNNLDNLNNLNNMFCSPPMAQIIGQSQFIYSDNEQNTINQPFYY